MHPKSSLTNSLARNWLSQETDRVTAGRCEKGLSEEKLIKDVRAIPHEAKPAEITHLTWQHNWAACTARQISAPRLHAFTFGGGGWARVDPKARVSSCSLWIKRLGTSNVVSSMVQQKSAICYQCQLFDLSCLIHKYLCSEDNIMRNIQYNHTIDPYTHWSWQICTTHNILTQWNNIYN